MAANPESPPARQFHHPVTGERLTIRRRSRDTNGESFEMDLAIGPRGFVAAAHIHPFQEERFLVTAGPITVRIGDQVTTAQVGETVVVPPGTPHAWWNAGDDEIAATVEFRPALAAETFFETFFGLAEDGKVNAKGMPKLLHLMVLGRAYRREMRLPRPVGTIMGPLAFLLAPVGRALGYRARYERYSGPLDA